VKVKIKKRRTHADARALGTDERSRSALRTLQHGSQPPNNNDPLIAHAVRGIIIEKQCYQLCPAKQLHTWR